MKRKGAGKEKPHYGVEGKVEGKENLWVISFVQDMVGSGRVRAMELNKE